MRGEGLTWLGSATHLKKVLSNPFYAGVVRWNGVEHRGNHVPLVDRATFDAVQDVLASRKHSYNRKPLGEFILRGVAQCAACGKRLTIERQRRWRYYKCWSGHRGDAYFNADLLHADFRRLCADLSLDFPDDFDARDVQGMFCSLKIQDNRIVGHELRELERLVA